MVVPSMAMSARYIAIIIALAAGNVWGKLAADLSQYNAECAVKVTQENDGLVARWKTGHGMAAVTFSLESGAALFEKLEVNGKTLASKIDPQFIVTTGSRKTQPGNKYTFFDKPASRPTE